MPTRILEFLHFNDVYHLVEQSSEPRGGFARFYTEVKRRRNQQGTKPLILFSGDCFNPSIESSVTKGKHMIPPLNLLGIDVACYGNHVSVHMGEGKGRERERDDDPYMPSSIPFPSC